MPLGRSFIPESTSIHCLILPIPVDMPNGYGLWVCPFLPTSSFAATPISAWTNYPCPVINSPSGAKSQAGDHGLWLWLSSPASTTSASPHPELAQATASDNHGARLPGQQSKRRKLEEGWRMENCNISCHRWISGWDMVWVQGLDTQWHH